MEKKLLSEQELLEESFVDSESNLKEERNGVLSRRDAIKKTLMAALVFSLSTVPVEALADNNANKNKEKKEAERKELYDLVRKIGLYMIENKTPYTLKFTPQHDKNWDILKIRFQDEKSAIFLETWFKGDTKPSIIDQYTLDSYLTLVNSKEKNGFDVIELH